MSRAPATTLSRVLRDFLTDFMDHVHTAMPCSVVSYTASTKTAVLQPLVQRRIFSGGKWTTKSWPQIPGVPVVFPGTKRWQVSGDLQNGDTGLAIFSEASLDAWLQSSGGQVDPAESNRFKLSDAVFYPGLFPSTSPGLAGVASGLLLQYGTGTGKILIQSNGNIQIAGGGQGAARQGDATRVDSTTDMAWDTFIRAVGAYCGQTYPGSITGKVNAGSSKVTIG